MPNNKQGSVECDIEPQALEFNVDQRVFYPPPASFVPIRPADKGRSGRRPGHAVSREVCIRSLNAAVERKRPGPLYKWWGARVLGVSVPTLRDMLRDYDLAWPPPWPPAN